MNSRNNNKNCSQYEYFSEVFSKTTSCRIDMATSSQNFVHLEINKMV